MLRFGIYILLSWRFCTVSGVTHVFAQARQRWEERRRCFSLLVYAIKDQHVLVASTQHPL